jgi:hypothetical protein
MSAMLLALMESACETLLEKIVQFGHCLYGKQGVATQVEERLFNVHLIQW